ncbi:hypothetical protein M426DRAFT_268578 [Hypoxylon sp. CI-4A]|nr:hypothetical protein M426DRAFT_268578 [Hypoxylon sp. CI-4A]
MQRFLTFVLALQVIGGSQAVTVHYSDDTCNVTQKSTIQTEMEYAVQMAQEVQGGVTNGVYFDTFFSENLRNNPDHASNVEKAFGRIGDMASGDGDTQFRVRCDPRANLCKRGYIAHMSDKNKIMNFCSPFFNEPAFRGTDDLLGDCNMDLRAAQRSRSAVIIHECTHTSYAMLDGDKALDYAYGYSGCTQLAQGTFDRSCVSYAKGRVLCPDSDGNESICSADYSGSNADTFGHVAAGIWFSQKCGKDIPLPPPPSVKMRDCGAGLDDGIAIDGGGDEDSDD